MKILLLIFFLFCFFDSTVNKISLIIFLLPFKAGFKVPPKGMCYVASGGNCYGCECKKPATCYKGTCR
ncbi:unnamed protein product [Caenorhabditis nigoni]